MLSLYVGSIALSSPGSLADPAGADALGTAAMWLQATLLGTVATVIAVMAVASVGLMTMSGRLKLRYGMTVIIGCFIVFGASGIVAGILATVGLGQPVSTAAFEPTPAAPPSTPLPKPPEAYDPYAGAAVPDNR